MTYQEIDFLFPFIVLAYGAMMTFVLNNQFLWQIAQRKFPPHLLKQMAGHRNLGLICLAIGSFWSLQNIWLN